MFFSVAMHKRLIIAFLTALICEFGGGTAVAEAPNAPSSRGTAILAVFSPASSPHHTLANVQGASPAEMDTQDANQQSPHTGTYLKTSPQSNGLRQASSVLFGGAADDPNHSSKTDIAGTRELFYKMMVSVVLVVVLGAIAIYASKRVMGKITNLPGKKIKIVETAHLGPRKAVHLLRIGDRCLLIGSTNDNITRLADLTTEIVTQKYIGND